MSRDELLTRYGAFYGGEHFAVAFTAGVTGDGAKRVVTKGWNQTQPLPDAAFGAGFVARGGADHNVAVVLRPSNLIVLECDSEADLVRIEQLELPATLTVRSSEPYKRHFYYRPAETLLALPYVAFRFESGKLTADSGRYFLAPPSLHPSGVMYDFVPDLGPDDVDIVELPEQRYRWLCEQAERESGEQREKIRVDPDAKIHAGQRRDLIFRYACMLRRWGRPYDAILTDCLAFNEERCEPPVERSLVEVQVQGAMKKQGDQELASPNGEVVQIVFEPLRSFLKRNLPPAEALVGVTRNGTNLLPRYGWVMPWGREGSGKTSIVVDLLFHAAAGLDWLNWPIGRSLRVVVVVNEGIPGGLQDKLEQKTEAWTENSDNILDNIAVYVSPWGEFSFRNPTLVQHARDYALDFGADYVAFDPLHTLGSGGGGKPEETEAFKHVLRKFGLWQDLGVLTSHHSNKAGMVSGDWGRHPDTVLHLEKDGKKPATKLTLEKARPADPAELGVPVLLEWITETLGYRRIEIEARQQVADDEILANIRGALAKAGGAPLNMGELQRATSGDDHRVRKLALAELAAGRISNVSTHAGRYALLLGDQTDTDNTGQPSESGDMQQELLGVANSPTTPEASAPPEGVVVPGGPLDPGRVHREQGTDNDDPWTDESEFPF